MRSNLTKSAGRMDSFASRIWLVLRIGTSVSLLAIAPACQRTAPPSTAKATCVTSTADLPPWASDYVGVGGRAIVGVRSRAVALVFAEPQAHRSDDGSNKILFVVDGPRKGQPLKIDGLMAEDGRSEKFETSQPADAGPGEIFPSIVDAPTAGCWRLRLKWATGTDDIYLRVG